MKNIKKYIRIIVFIFAMGTLFAQTPPPPNNGATGSGGTTPVGGGAPVSGGLAILLVAAGAYGLVQYRMKPKYEIAEEME